MKDKVYYKAVRRLEGGRRVSQFIPEGGKDNHEMLEYKPNSITQAPPWSKGIFCYPTLETADSFIEGNTDMDFTGIVEIHEAHPIGEMYADPMKPSWVRLFPAIRLGKTVYRAHVVNGKLQRPGK